MTRTQVALVGVGGVGIAVGAVLLVVGQTGAVPAVVLWAVGPVVVHDLLLAPVAVAVAWVAGRVLPRAVWPAVVAGVLATAALTALAVTVLGRPGAVESNPSLLDRDYVTGYLAALAVVWGGVVLWSVLALRRTRGGTTADVAH